MRNFDREEVGISYSRIYVRKSRKIKFLEKNLEIKNSQEIRSQEKSPEEKKSEEKKKSPKSREI